MNVAGMPDVARPFLDAASRMLHEAVSEPALRTTTAAGLMDTARSVKTLVSSGIDAAERSGLVRGEVHDALVGVSNQTFIGWIHLGGDVARDPRSFSPLLGLRNLIDADIGLRALLGIVA